MTIEPIPFELGRFFAESKSGREPHVVDLAYQPNPWSKPMCACGCESNFIYGRMCKHIEATVEFELNRLQL